MWFEMGVRDDVTKTLKGITDELMKVEDGIERVKRSMENDLTRAIYRIREVAERTQQAISKGMSLGLDTGKLQEGLRKMQEEERKLLELQKMPVSKLNRGTIASLTGAEFEAMIRNMRRMAIAQEGLNRTRERGTQQSLRQEVVMQERLVAAYDKATGAMNRQGRAMSQLRNIAGDYVSVYAGTNLLRELIVTGGEFETQRIAMQTMLGDLRQGQEIYSQIQSLAIESPMGFRELAGYTKQLAAYNIPYEELYDTTKRLADISAGVGVDMGRLILAYGQVRSASVLRGSELRQFTEAGIPMVEALAEKFTELKGEVVTTGDVLGKLIPTRQVPFEMVKEVLKEMTDEGGRFYNMQFVLADTLAGKWSNLRDAWEVMLSGIADGRTLTGEWLKEAVGGITELIKSMDTLLPLITAVGLGWGMKRTAGWATERLGYSLGGVNAALLSAKELEAQRLTRKALVKGADALTAREKELLATRRQLTAYDYRMIAASGRLSTLQIARLYREDKISGNTLRQLVGMKAITAEQRKQIMQGNRLVGIQATLRQAASGIGSTLMGIAKDPFTWITIAMAGFMELQSAISETESMMAQAAESANQRYKSLAETMKSINEAGRPTSNNGFTQSNETMLGALEGKAADYDGIKEQASAIKDLGERYEYLKGVLEQTAEAYKWVAANGGTIGGLLDSTGGLQTSQGFWAAIGSAVKGDWLTDDLAENMEDWDEYNAKLQSAAVSLGKYEVQIRDAIDRAVGDNEKLRKSLDGKSLEEQLRIIADSDYWDKLSLRVAGSAKDALDSWLEAGFKLRIEGGKVENGAEKMTKGISRILDRMAKSRGETVEDFVKNNEVMVSTMIENIVRGFNTGSEQIQNRVIDLVRRFVGLKEQYDELGRRIGAPQQTQYQKQSRLGKQMMHNVISRYGNGVITVAEMNEIAGTTEQAKETSAALDDLKKKVQSLRNEYDSLNAVYGENSTRTKAAKRELDRYTKVAEANGLTLDDLNKKQKYGYTKDGKKGEDEWLKAMQARMSLLPKYISLYEKYRDTLGEAEARAKVNSDVQFESLRQIGITDPTNEVAAYKRISDLLNDNATTAERRRKAEEALQKVYDAQAEAIVRHNRILNETSAKQLETMQKQWDMYRRWLDATGDAGIAGTVAFGEHTDYENIAEQLRDEVNEKLKIKNEKLTVDDVLGMSATELDETFGKAGQDADGLRERIDALREAEQKLSEETLNGLLEMIEASKGYEAQLADIDRELEKQIELINKTKFSEDADENERIRAQYRDDATDAADRKRSEVLFKQFQEESDWVTIFDDLDRVSTATITGMIDKIEEFSRTAGLSVEDVKKLRDALDKLRQENLERNPFVGLADAVGRANALRKLLERTGSTGSAGKIEISEAEAKRTGLQAGEYKRAQIETALRAAEDDVVRSVEGIGKAFDDLQNVLNPVIELFDTLGADTGGIGDVLGTIGGALGAASSTGSSLSNLMGMSVGEDKTLGEALGIKNAGLWGAAAGAALSVTTSIFALHDKALQKEIEASQARQKEMENLTANVQRVIDRLMGGVYRYRASDADLDGLLKYVDYEVPKGGEGSIFDKYRYIGGDTKEQIREAEKSRSYYDTYLASLMVQRDELAHQMDAERDKKKSDAGAIADMKAEIAELDDQIRYVAEDMAEELYGIDFKGWAADLSQTLVDAWASGADAADAYRKKVSEILRDVGVNVITQKYLEPQLEEQMEKFMDYFEANNGIVDEAGMDLLAGMYDTAEEAADMAGKWNDLMEQMANEHGETLKDTGSASNSTIGGSISEEEAGLGLAYLNSIRADTAMIRTSAQKMAEELMPEVANVLAVHTATLKAIEANTGRGADAAEAMRDLLGQVANGTKKLNVITYIKKN